MEQASYGLGGVIALAVGGLIAYALAGQRRAPP